MERVNSTKLKQKCHLNLRALSKVGKKDQSVQAGREIKNQVNLKTHKINKGSSNRLSNLFSIQTNKTTIKNLLLKTMKLF
jgi:hypothetical protein